MSRLLCQRGTDFFQHIHLLAALSPPAVQTPFLFCYLHGFMLHLVQPVFFLRRSFHDRHRAT